MQKKTAADLTIRPDMAYVPYPTVPHPGPPPSDTQVLCLIYINIFIWATFLILVCSHKEFLLKNLIKMPEDLLLLYNIIKGQKKKIFFK